MYLIRICHSGISGKELLGDKKDVADSNVFWEILVFLFFVFVLT